MSEPNTVKYDEVIKKAEVMVEALPYIQKFYGKSVVIKYGGNAMVNEELKNLVMQDIVLLKYIGMKPIVVHGGGPDISSTLKKFDVKSEFVNGLRVTDSFTMDVAQMVLVGKTNKEIVKNINEKGGKAAGLSGLDGRLIECKKHYETVNGVQTDIGYVGEITKVNTEMIELLASDEYIPVIAPIGIGPDGHSYNINADTVASEVAIAMKAEKLILLTDTEGVINSMTNELLEFLTVEEVYQLIDEGIITSGMIPKVLGCVEAIRNGVLAAHIIDGRIPHCLLLEIFTHKGIGTMIINE